MFHKIHMFRIKPGQELLTGIERYCQEHGISSAIVIGIIGSLQSARLNFLTRLPGKYDSVDYAGPIEIVVAQGSVALVDNKRLIHVHIQLSSRDMCCGGHLAQATVFSTAEVTIGELDYQLRRQPDDHTGLNELID